MNQYLEIPFRLPGLNEVNSANRANRYKGAQMKRETDEALYITIKAAHLLPVTKPCIVHMLFEEPNRRRDVDNVESAKKFILDALVKAGVIVNDSPKYVIGAPSFTRYADGARVLVTIIEDESEDYLRSRLHRMSEVVTEDDGNE